MKPPKPKIEGIHPDAAEVFFPFKCPFDVVPISRLERSNRQAWDSLRGDHVNRHIWVLETLRRRPNKKSLRLLRMLCASIHTWNSCPSCMASFSLTHSESPMFGAV